MRLSRIEQETVIRRSAADREWDIYSDDLAIQRKLDRQGWEGEPQGEFGRRYLLPRAAITIRSASGIQSRRDSAKRRKLRFERQESVSESTSTAMVTTAGGTGCENDSYSC